MHIDWDTPITMEDGLVLRADVFRPPGAGTYPVILSHGPYAKGLSIQEGYKGNWARLIKAAPEVLRGSSNTIHDWELVCVRARRLALRRPLGRPSRRMAAARFAGHVPL